MERILKRYTIIPEHLYVNRVADQQLKRIVEDMQRPGYVLVARQMGKTNLLFNAKRNLENYDRLFIYIDLSNLFEHDRDCYRNIIDNIMESNRTLYTSVESQILSTRGQSLSPHLEYSKSLRIVLEYFKGNIVIILDEIDALQNMEYSDNIFAQIRSSYFLRTNYPEFERLTYVLSGVIEPSQLIKDRNKSPFNIGEKIYLDDFTKEEHNCFIEKSKLPINSEISDEIFNWVHGNPRMTFDICAEVEAILAQEHEISKERLVDMINQKYLISYDIAPIDHIRTLVRSNREARKAILNILKGDSQELTDEIKRKLYLYGIINSNFLEDIKIKNRVIELSLSEEWLKSIDRKTESTIVYGLAHYTNKEYKNAIETLVNCLSRSNINRRDIELANYYIGLSHYHLKNYKEALNYLSGEFIEEGRASDAQAYCGLCLIILGQKNEGLSLLEKSIETETHSHVYHTALLNIALSLDESEHERTYSLLQRLYDSTFEVEEVEGTEQLQEFRTLSLFYQGVQLSRRNCLEQAFEKARDAIDCATPSDSLFIIRFLYEIEQAKDESLKKLLVDTIIQNVTVFDEDSSRPISFTSERLIMYLEWVFDQSNINLFEKLLEYSIVHFYPKQRSKNELIYQISRVSDTKKTEILKYLLKFEADLACDLLVQVYGDMALHYNDNPHNFLKYFDKYINVFLQSDKIEIIDVFLFTYAIGHYSDTRQYTECFRLCDIIEDRLSRTEDASLKIESLIIFYLHAYLYHNQSNLVGAVEYADKALNLINKYKNKRTSIVDEEEFKFIYNQMIQIKSSSSFQTPFKRERSRKYSRNEKIRVKYTDGSIAEGKYKNLEADILAERCEIL